MILTIFKKELKVFFRSPLSYVMIGLFTSIVGWFFFNQLVYFTENAQKMPVHLRSDYDFINIVVMRMFDNINLFLLFFIPILTMKSFSQEYRDETINIYFSSRVSDFELILGKFLAYFVMGCMVISSVFIFPLFFGNINIADISFFITGSIGVILNVACYISLGLLASSFTKNQILAAMCGFAFVSLLWILTFMAQTTPNYALANLLKFISINHHYLNFVKGRLLLSDFSYYISFLAIIFLIIRKRLDMRNWG